MLHNRDFESIDPVDENVQCFVKCFFKKAKWVDQSGVLNKAQMEADVPPDVQHEISAIVNQCTPLVGETACETAFKQTKCFITEYKKVEREYAAKFSEHSEQHLQEQASELYFVFYNEKVIENFVFLCKFRLCGDTKIIKIYNKKYNRKRDSGVYHFIFFFSRHYGMYYGCDETEIKKM